MKLSVGIVGLPNVGKSTLFNALRQAQGKLAQSANYPFTTIEPNIGIVPVPDTRLPELAKTVRTTPKASQSGGQAEGTEVPVIPATVKFVDIAGLVKGAAEGEGLGNKFLAHIREVSLVVHVLRDFTDANVVQTGSGDPVEDFATIETELQLADLETLSKQSEPKGKVTKEETAKWEVIREVKSKLEDGVSVSQVNLGEEELELIHDLFLLTAKPRMFAVNVGEDKLVGAGEVIQEAMEKFQARGVEVSKDQLVVISAKLEEELAGFGEAEKKEYLKEAGVEMTGLEFLIKKAYKRLGLVSFLTAGEKEVRAWTIEGGMTAPEAAGVIHSDFEKHFINAKVCDYGDFVGLGGWKEASEAGRVRQEGRDYVVQGNDIIEFVVNV